jgi:hypothetical protein
MLERYNPLLRLVCIALIGLIIYQVSRIAFRRDAIARSNFEPLPARVEITNKVTIETNAPAVSTNLPAPAATNVVSTNKPTNHNAAVIRAVRSAGGPMGPMGGAPKQNLPPDVQALVDKIRQSQLLGPDIKPPPMALLGIAGKDVFLRGPNGQTGVIREGEELGGVKLIRVGTNRVVVEENKQQRELMIFSGLGSETLLEKKEKREPLH